MTPEQLEEIPGIGPKTIEKISFAVNEYFSNLEAAENAAAVENAETVAEAVEENAEQASADTAEAVDIAAQAEGDDEYKEDAETGQSLEAAAIAGVENAPAADVAEVHVHGEEPTPAPEDMVAPEEEK